MDYMGKVLKGVPEAAYTLPENMVTERINDEGQRDPDGKIVEYFYVENIPPEREKSLIETIIDQIF